MPNHSKCHKNKYCDDKSKRCHKKCESSSSSSSSSCSSSSSSCESTCSKTCEKKKCEKRCKPPKVVYQACINGGTAALTLTYVVSPTTFTCPTAIGQVVTITYTVTNTGTAAIKSPRYVYDSLTGVHKVGKCKLLPNQFDTFIVRYTITRCDCNTTNNISLVANAYTPLNCGKLILVSQPVSIVIQQTPPV